MPAASCARSAASVVAENLIVGLVVFAVITIVQLIVVARGAERVAEVSARFALDAMPGKQMAIDAELRTGAIDADTARKRRGDLERESQLYGAMDGAMRFVKGDAIAAIVIVVINLIGGLAIGIGSRGMTAGEAIKTYSLLSIGAGLVAQIPSLLVAVASGLLVTRVASSGDRPLGEDLGVQLAGSPRALARCPRSCCSAGRSGPACRSAPSSCSARSPPPGRSSRHEPSRPARVVTLDETGAQAARGPRLGLQLSTQLHARLAPRTAELHQVLVAARSQVATRSGLELPPLGISTDTSLGADELALAIDGTPVAWMRLAGEPFAALRDRLADALAPFVPDLIGVDRVAAMVERAAAHAPILVREVVPRVVALPVLAEVLREARTRA